MSDSALLTWANRAAVTAFTLNFVNYETELAKMSGLFTPAGWTQFKKALISSNNLEALTAKKLVSTAVATGAPVIVNQGPLNGAWAWKVTIPLLVTYESASEMLTKTPSVTMVISRVSPLVNPNGIAISQFVAGSGAVG